MHLFLPGCRPDRESMRGRRFLVTTWLLAAGWLTAIPRLADAGPPPAVPVTTRVVDPGAADGGTGRMLYLSPVRPRATLVMLPGGTGRIGIRPDGSLAHGDNFVVRTRSSWTARGYAVLIPDAAGGADLHGSRSTPSYRAVVERITGYARRLAPVPVVLLGTSQGTIAATNGAGSSTPDAGPTGLAALVLTETVSEGGRLSAETVFDAHPDAVRVPTLIVADEDDACDVAPPQAAGRIAAAFTAAPRVDVAKVGGGGGRSDRPCGSRSPHGYDGIGDRVVELIDTWLAAHLPTAGAR